MPDVEEETRPSLQFSSAEFENEVYASVARSARLRDVCMVESAFSARVESIRYAQISDEKLQFVYNESEPEITFDQESGLALGHFRWSVEVRKGREKLLRLKAKFVVVYSGLEESAGDYVYLYVAKVGRFASYPYFRSHFATQSSSAGIMLPPLPAITDRVD